MRNKAEIFVALAVALAAFLTTQDAHASACSVALKKYNAAVDADGKEYISSIKRDLKILPRYVSEKNADHCQKMIPIWQARLPRLVQLGQLSATMQRSCSKLHWVE